MQQNNLENLRRRFFAIITFLGGITTIALLLLLGNPATAIRYSNIACSIAWLILAVLFQFSSIKLARLEIFAFATLVTQFILTELLEFLISEAPVTSFFPDVINILLILIILILTAYSLFTKRRATQLSIVFSLVSAITILIGAMLLPHTVSYENLFRLIEPICYFIICFYFIAALSSFRSKASTAESEAKQFEQLAYYDELTGIANRRKLVDILQKEISAAKRYDTSLSIIIFDIDYFKKVNDTYGHNVGDQVLKAVANTVANTVRTSDSLGRWGGEEFLCILPHTTVDVAFELAERLRLGIAAPLIDNGPTITASFGIAQLTQVDNFDSLVLRADQALYSAKEQGRNRCMPNPIVKPIVSTPT